MVPVFETYLGDDYGILTCPACGFNYLHHEAVEVFARDEDDEEGLHVRVATGDAMPPNGIRGQTVAIGRALAGNPSGRRGGVAIRFWCEGCHAHPVLTIAQHKGHTLVEMRKEEKPNG
jgi:hypothetical protein